MLLLWLLAPAAKAEQLDSLSFASCFYFQKHINENNFDNMDTQSEKNSSLIDAGCIYNAQHNIIKTQNAEQNQEI